MWDKLINELPWFEKIRILRVAKGLSQEKAATKCMTNQKMWWNWETGKNYPRKINRHAIAKTFGVDVEDIFPDDTKEK